jgi:hypothetical protein
MRWEASMPWYDTQIKVETIVPGQQSTVSPARPEGGLCPAVKAIPLRSHLLRGEISDGARFAWAPDVYAMPRLSATPCRAQHPYTSKVAVYCR